MKRNKALVAALGAAVTLAALAGCGGANTASAVGSASRAKPKRAARRREASCGVSGRMRFVPFDGHAWVDTVHQQVGREVAEHRDDADGERDA